jgi:ubiquinone/menaquinone biosynthesis C-methylase UbiE
MKKVIKKLIKAMNLGVLGKYSIDVLNTMTNKKHMRLNIPFTSFSIVSYKASKTFTDHFNEGGEGYILPSKDELPITPLLNWKPLEDQSRIKETALDYRAEISSNLYAQAFRNKWAGKLSVSGGRAFWRLETMRQVRKSNPGIFNGKVIEIGAGTGIVSSTISQFPEVKELFCLDYEESTVINLMPLVQYSLEADYEKIKRVVGSYNQMQLSDEEIDTIVAVGAMHHSEDLDATLKECYRILKPGGHFIISEYAMTNNLSQEEYSMLMNCPISEKEAEKFVSTGSMDGVRTRKTISEHARPLFIYQAAAFNAGFSISTHIFDATKENGGYFSRISRYVKSARKKQHMFAKHKCNRENGYDHFGNVKSFEIADPINYPIYATNKPSLLKLALLGDQVSKPLYDNIVMIMEKPKNDIKSLPYRYNKGKVFSMPVNIMQK